MYETPRSFIEKQKNAPNNSSQTGDTAYRWGARPHRDRENFSSLSTPCQAGATDLPGGGERYRRGAAWGETTALEQATSLGKHLLRWLSALSAPPPSTLEGERKTKQKTRFLFFVLCGPARHHRLSSFASILPPLARATHLSRPRVQPPF